jgi:arsenate reductase (thioredoxin)
MALKVLSENLKIDASDARSKSWDEFKYQELDFVITLCDKARETCPIWPGQPIIAHWSSPDPVEIEGSPKKILKAFWVVSQQINRCLELLCSLRFDNLDALRLEAATRAIGEQENIQFEESITDSTV